jgi:hypothetical protein
MEQNADKGLEHPAREGRTPAGSESLPSSADPWLGLDSDALMHSLATRFREVAEAVAASLQVPVAFAEGFLRSLLSIESVEEDEEGRVIIKPRAGASEEDILREVDEITALIDPTSVYNPVARRQMDSVVEGSDAVMRQDLSALADMTPEELHSALSRLEPDPQPLPEETRSAAEEVRARMDQVREALRRYQAGYAETHAVIDSDADEDPQQS